MEKNLRLLIFIFFISLLEATIFNYLLFFRTKPDLLLTLVVVLTLSLKPNQALFLSLVCGIVKDTLAGSAFGAHILLFPLWCFLIIKLSRKISLENNLICIILVFLIDIIQNIFFRLTFLFSGVYIAWYVFLRIIFLEALYTCAIFPVMLKTYKLFKLRVNR